ncbi:substrate-binding periplasmic protein [Pseudoduganella violaceinigra]|uniref:substrate-binding periplasmic protein n=1 Tax=Pseudoduganella violaceinigra TaxID=246602 RepID=UPI0004010D93|nr:ABC transporter substrate-binding protein [Pseudoduganella violaceinigra]
MKVISALIPALLAIGPASAAPLVVLVDTGTEMPLADIRNGEVVGGIHKDLAEALAQKLGRTPVTLSMPRKRIAMALEAGRGDVLCLYLPEWLPGHYGWTQAFMPQTEMVITASSAAQPQSLADLAGQPIGTVLGFQYPEMERAMGSGFVRADVNTNLANLRKLAAGRLRHVATIKTFYDYQLHKGEKLSVHEPLVVRSYQTRCAVSAKGHVAVAEVDAAITQLLREGVISKILSNYQ